MDYYKVLKVAWLKGFTDVVPINFRVLLGVLGSYLVPIKWGILVGILVIIGCF